ncbi:putative hydrolase [Gordonia hirsuta DSM 44140 = NBRC 16056]|uniref:Putative hydrolase n=1 Tax=Gordonia hirsuta DSM 44140 = NBRC 16056 TaxID=1121927 RepID=L7L9K3_9ACTN|nr:putative hydrolase [Gordonia hirsuta DSM 44140 = NBRC 16056]
MTATDPAPIGRIHAPDSLTPDLLDGLTDIGEEAGDAADAQAAQQIWSAAQHWYQAGTQPGISVCIRRRGEVIVNRAIGHARGNGPDDVARRAVGETVATEPLRTDTPVCVFSTAKAMASTVVHLLIERGELRLSDRIDDLLPGYGAHGKARTTLDHVMTHRAGVPIPTGPRPDLSRSEDSAYARDMLSNLRPVYPPGTLHVYHALTWGPLIREVVAAATGRSIRDILAAEILAPLGFEWTNFGVSPRDVARVAPSYATGPPTSGIGDALFTRVVGGTLAKTVQRANSAAFLTGVVPSSNAVSTAEELSRFAELLRLGGELDGTRVLWPATVRAATRQRRRLRPDVATGGVPLRWGTGFMLGSQRFGPFGRDAPAAFGHTGLTQIAMWADPQRDLAAAVVSTGKPSAHPEAGRYGDLLDTISTVLPRRH